MTKRSIGEVLEKFSFDAWDPMRLSLPFLFMNAFIIVAFLISSVQAHKRS